MLKGSVQIFHKRVALFPRKPLISQLNFKTNHSDITGCKYRIPFGAYSLYIIIFLDDDYLAAIGVSSSGYVMNFHRLLKSLPG